MVAPSCNCRKAGDLLKRLVVYVELKKLVALITDILVDIIAFISSLLQLPCSELDCELGIKLSRS